MTFSVSILGVGRLGGALALALSKKNYAIRQLISHEKTVSKISQLMFPAPEILSSDEFEKISGEIIFIAVPDAEIQIVARKLAEKIKHKPFVFHTSGALSSEILQPLKIVECRIGSLHPLISVSNAVTGAERFKNAFFCLEGGRSAIVVAEKIVADLEGKSFSIPTEFKALYHASAVMASGHLVALISVAVETLAICGLNENEARNILFPLIQSTLKNLSAQTPAQALTGTFARADVETLKRHLESLSENATAQAREIYRQLGLRSLHLAEQQNADAEKLAKMRKILIEDES